MVIHQRELVKNKIKIKIRPFPFIFLWGKNRNEEELTVAWMSGYLHCPVNNELGLQLTKHSRYSQEPTWEVRKDWIHWCGFGKLSNSKPGLDFLATFSTHGHKQNLSGTSKDRRLTDNAIHHTANTTCLKTIISKFQSLD